MEPLLTKSDADDIATSGHQWDIPTDTYTGTLYNPNGTPVTPSETEAQYAAEWDAAAGEAAKGSLSNYLSGVGETIAGVAELGALFVAPELDAAIGGIGGAVAAGALTGADTSALSTEAQGKTPTLGGLAEGALIGGAGGALAYGAAPATSALTSSGVPAPVSSALVKGASGALVGGVEGDLSGKGIGEGAELGAIGGAASGLASGLGSEAGLSTGQSSFIGGLAKSGVTELASSTLTSPSGSGATGASPTGATVSTPADQIQPSLATPLTSATTPTLSGSSSLGTLGTAAAAGGLSSLIPSASTVGGMAPYLAVGAIGLEQANAGEEQAAQYSQTQQNLAQPAISESNTLLSNYQSGKINPIDQTASTTQIAQGQAMLNNPNLASLSSIAQTAFANYNSGTLNAADALTLQQNTDAAKQQVASQLAASGITDSSVLAAQYAQIDNNAQIQKQTMLNNYFNTGNTAYNQWLTTTEAGNAAIVAGQQIASQSLQTELANSMAEANIGIGEMNTAISTQMQTDAEYAAQVSQLMGTLATAYAKSVAGQQSGASSAAVPSTGGLGAPSAGAGSLNTPVPTGAAGAGLYSQGATTGDNSLASEAQPDLNSLPNPGDTPLNFTDDTSWDDGSDI
jgi:hypothetical protein